VSIPLPGVPIQHERDVVVGRQRARRLAELLGFDPHEQTRIATAVSEIARNAYAYAGGGRIEFEVEGDSRPQLLVVRVIDAGRGIANLAGVLSGEYRSPTGMGLGIVGSKRLMDAFEIESSSRGTAITMRKLLPRGVPLVTPATAKVIVDGLARDASFDPFAALRQQNAELMRTLDDLRRRQEELERLNAEIEDTNRGVVALYAELDERADHLRRADDLKTKFLSNMSHEFRTPLNSILALSRLLLDRVDGPLTSEQERQIAFIRKAADELAELVNDLLDLAKVEAGKTVIRPAECEIDKLFGALRGMLRPLLLNPVVALVFEDASELPPVTTDEAKVSQIVRNFISNALKFTERGEVRVSARLTDGGRAVAIAVRDTGIGIAPEHQPVIFEDFTQIEHQAQRRVRGTGLGLPLARRLAHLLGGTISLDSEVGVGSTFTLTLPLVFSPPGDAAAGPPAARRELVDWEPDPARIPVLVVGATAASGPLAYQDLLRGSLFQVLAARSAMEAGRLLARLRPRVMLLHLDADDEAAWELLARLKQREHGPDALPVLALVRREDCDKASALGADVCLVAVPGREELLDTLRRLVGGPTPRRVLVIDDDDVARYLMKSFLRDTSCVVSEAGGGREGLEAARTQRPDMIFCDIFMPDMTGIEVLSALRADARTRDIPVVLNTAKALSDQERTELERQGVPLLLKDRFSRSDAAAEIRRLLLESGIDA
jgi:signal transduction histidine kinase/CheY-like chemotaxis protein